MDVESELQRVLLTRDIPVPVGDPVPAVHAGIRRRRRNQRLQALAAGTSVVVIAVAASLTLGGHTSAQRQLPTGPTQQTLGAVPPGFQVRDVSFSSSQRAWALGTAGCRAGTCTVLLDSVDGGKSWQASNGLEATLPAADGSFTNDCTTITCVSHLRFVTSKTGDVIGYAYGPGLSISTDGGLTWANQKVTGSVVALEAANGNAIRVMDPQGGCPCTSFAVESAPLGGSTWSPVNTAKGQGPGELEDARLTRQGQRLALLLHGHTAGGAQDAHSTVLTSTDNGQKWITRGDPCGRSLTHEIDASQLALAPDGIVAALCTPREPGTTAVAVSTDGGKTYGRQQSTGVSATFVAAIPGALVVAGPDATGGHEQLLRSTDDGRSWTKVAAQLSKSSFGSQFLGFTSDTQGTWVGADLSRIVRTSDGGRTWTDRPFR